MRRRMLLATLALVLLVAPLAPVAPASAQDDPSPTPTATPTPTSTPTPEPAATNTTETGAESYTIEELQRGGQTQEGAPPSMRYLGSYGSATVRHNPVGLGSSEWEYLSRDTRVQRDEITLRTIRLGEPDEELTVNVVAWERGVRTVEGENGSTTTEPVATNVTTREVSAQLGRGYDSAEIPIPSSFGESQRVTVWVEQYPSARWTFSHRTVATERTIDINSWGDFLSTLFWQIGVFALPALVLGGLLGRRHHQKAIVGPQWGLLKWGLAIGIPVALLASVFAFQGAVLATRLPAGMALIVGSLAYAIVLESGPENLQKFLFRRQDLERAKSPRGEDTHDSRYVDHVVKTGLRREADQELVLIRKGLPAFVARLRGSLATLDISEIQTHKKGKRSPYELEIELDPDHDLHDALVHEPPRLDRLPLSRPVDIPGLGRTSLPNPGVVLPIGGGAAAGWLVADALLGIPGVGAVVGGVVGLPFLYRVENGDAASEPAPYHSTQAEASLAYEAGEHADAKLLDEYREIAWSERMKTPLDALRVSSDFDESQSRRLIQDELGSEWTSEVHDAAEPDDRGPEVADDD